MLVDAAARSGLSYVPDAYVVLGNGVINAAASGHGFRRFVFINSDLLEVGGAAREPEALRFVIAHEVGHIAAGHVSYWRILGTFASQWIPVVGSTLSRAQEYTADNYGHALAPQGARLAMATLAGGKYLNRSVDVDAMADRAVTEPGFFVWVTNASATHPVLLWRMHALRDRRRPGRLLWRPREPWLWGGTPLPGTYSLPAMIGFQPTGPAGIGGGADPRAVRADTAARTARLATTRSRGADDAAARGDGRPRVTGVRRIGQRRADDADGHVVAGRSGARVRAARRSAGTALGQGEEHEGVVAVEDDVVDVRPVPAPLEAAVDPDLLGAQRGEHRAVGQLDPSVEGQGPESGVDRRPDLGAGQLDEVADEARHDEVGRALVDLRGTAVHEHAPRSMTATESAIERASSWSCVTMTAVALMARRTSRTSVRTCARRPASSAEKGSSSTTTPGLGASARASATRCC